jgi:hypothetical protein
VDEHGQTLADLGEAGVVGGRIAGAVAEEGPQRAAVGATPGDAALRADTLEVADQEHAEVDARWYTGAADVRGVVGRAEVFDEGVEVSFVEDLVEARVKGIGGRCGEVLEGDDDVQGFGNAMAQHGWFPPGSWFQELVHHPLLFILETIGTFSTGC